MGEDFQIRCGWGLTLNETFHAYANACGKDIWPLRDTICGLTEFVTDKKFESC